MRYNYVLSAALDSGTALAVIVIYFSLQFPSGPAGEGYSIEWWGNTYATFFHDLPHYISTLFFSVFTNTLDATGARLIPLEDGQTFGPTTWI